MIYFSHVYVIHSDEYLQKAARKENLRPIPSVFSENHRFSINERHTYEIIIIIKSTCGFVHASLSLAVSVIIIRAITTPY